MVTDPRVMFRFDTAGAAVSLLLLGVILPRLQAHLGVPASVLYGLALWAGGCLLYDLLCLRLATLTQPQWLGGIVLANALYCILSAVLLVVHSDALTPLGVAYFVVDILVILAVIAIEVQLLRRLGASEAATGA